MYYSVTSCLFMIPCRYCCIEKKLNKYIVILGSTIVLVFQWGREGVGVHVAHSRRQQKYS